MTSSNQTLEIPEKRKFFLVKSSLNGGFSPDMFDYCRVVDID